jgi:hypothetical protein
MRSGFRVHPEERVDMANELGNLRALTAAEIGFAESRWINRVRRNLWIQGGCAALCAALAIVSGGIIFIAGAVVMSLVCLKSRRDLDLISRDLSAGLVEEITGSMRKAETGALAYSLAYVFGPVPALIAGLARFLRYGVRARGNRPRPASVGAQLLLVRSNSTEVIRVFPGLYPDVPDGTLLKAVVLPDSRVALRVGRTSLGGS